MIHGSIKQCVSYLQFGLQPEDSPLNLPLVSAIQTRSITRTVSQRRHLLGLWFSYLSPLLPPAARWRPCISCQICKHISRICLLHTHFRAMSKAAVSSAATSILDNPRAVIPLIKFAHQNVPLL